MDTEYVMVYITTESADEARRIGRALVEERLAACVNICPVESVFEWRGDLCQEHEAAMLVKTRAGRLPDLIDRVRDLHSYELPDIVSWPIAAGYPPYLEWIGESTH